MTTIYDAAVQQALLDTSIEMEAVLSDEYEHVTKRFCDFCKQAASRDQQGDIRYDVEHTKECPFWRWSQAITAAANAARARREEQRHEIRASRPVVSSAGRTAGRAGHSR